MFEWFNQEGGRKKAEFQGTPQKNVKVRKTMVGNEKIPVGKVEKLLNRLPRSLSKSDANSFFRCNFRST